MSRFPLKLSKSLEKRKSCSSFRTLKLSKDLVDFSSNDYLGFAGNLEILERTTEILKEYSLLKNGSGGSRLLTGNHELFVPVENLVAAHHKAEAALIFNSGYDANVGLFSAVPGRGDLILYDELIHASIRDGIGLSAAKSVKFNHNDLEDLQEKTKRLKNHISGDVYLVTESVFSMDGDSPDLRFLVNFSEANNIHLIVDEAHAMGVRKTGLIAEGLEEKVFARIVTFGKALGVHGAAVLGSEILRDYLINFSRSFIYSTAATPHSIAAIMAAYEQLQKEAGDLEIQKLQENISFFKAEVSKMGLQKHFFASDSAIQCCVIPGNEEVRRASARLEKAGFDVRPIQSPTVSAGMERLRICLHSFNTREEIKEVLLNLSKMTL